MSTNNLKFNWINNPLFFLFMIALGLVTGLFIPASIKFFHPILEAYVHLLNLFVYPFVLLTIIFGLARFSHLPNSLKRFTFALCLGLIGLFLSGLLTIVVSVVISPGSLMSESMRSTLGRLSLDNESFLTVSLFSKSLLLDKNSFEGIIPSNLLYAFAYKSLPIAMVGSLIFGLGFTFLPSLNIKSFFEQLEVIYIALENLIILVNKFLPFIAFIFALDLVNLGQMGFFSISIDFILPFLIVILFFGFINIMIISWKAEVKLPIVFQGLTRAILISFFARSPVAGVPEVISILCDKFGLQRSMVRFFSPLIPIFFNAGEVVIFTLTAIYVANIYGQQLFFFDLISIVTLAIVFAFLTTSSMGSRSLIMATFLLYSLNLPFEALFTPFFLLELFLSGAISSTSILFSSAVIALVSTGLAKEVKQENILQDLISYRSTEFFINRKLLFTIFILFVFFNLTVFLIGIASGVKISSNLFHF
jgi:hypothetical protein